LGLPGFVQSSFTSEIDCATALAEPSTTNSTILFPNPSALAFTLKLSENSSVKLSVKVYDVAGRLVEEFILEANQNEKTFGEKYVSGSYFITAEAKEEMRFFKLIKL